MLRRIVVVVIGLFGVVILFAAVGLTWAHSSLRSQEIPLPDLATLAEAPHNLALPVSISYINTASQPMPRAAVLSTDPTPDAPYIMSHPSFVLRWADGKIALIDTGMTPDDAIKFGRPLEWAAGAQPTQAHTSVADALGNAVESVARVMFTHLHTDHVGGLGAICEKRDQPLTIVMTPAQATNTNYTTRPGRGLIDDAHCARVETITGQGLQQVPGLPGVSVFAAGGHTPDTQVILAWVKANNAPRLYVFVGDVVNNIDAITHNIPKPFLYRTFIVPEDDARLAELRVLLRQLHDEHGAILLPAHDQLAIEASGMPKYAANN